MFVLTDKENVTLLFVRIYFLVRKKKKKTTLTYSILFNLF